MLAVAPTPRHFQNGLVMTAETKHTDTTGRNQVQIRDRIKELRRVRAGDLIPHANNWRNHPTPQRDVLRGLLDEVGYAAALLVRQLPDGRLEIIDGHLRAETTPDSQVPVLVLDVNQEEARKIVLTHDPLAAMATADKRQVRDLVRACEFEQPSLVQLLDQLEQVIERAHRPFQEPATYPEVEIPESYQVVVECRNEEEQQQMYIRLREEGYRCRVLTL